MGLGNKNDISHFCLNFNLGKEDSELHELLKKISKHEGKKVGPIAKRLLFSAAKKRVDLIDKGLI